MAKEAPRKRNTLLVVGILLALPDVCQSFQVSSFPSFKARRNGLQSTCSPDSHSHLERHDGRLFMSSEIRDEQDTPESPNGTIDTQSPTPTKKSVIQSAIESLNINGFYAGKRPPPEVEDTSVLFYDVFLIINLTVSISFWSAHRMNFDYIGAALSEGCLMSLLWIGAGLYTGAFLYSAADGHYGASDERGGPKAAGLLGLNTFLNAVNLRLVFALGAALLQHRHVGSALGEELLPLEIGFGLVLMGGWRALHSSYLPRL
jgi:hypothetical protein